MAGIINAFRARLFRGVHAEAAKRKIDHDALHDLCKERYGVHSMGDLTDGQLEGLYHAWTKKGFKRKGHLPRRGEASSSTARAEIVSGRDVEDLAAEFARRGMGEEGRRNFIARQLKGRTEIRTRSDYARVMGGLRGMRKREEKKNAGLDGVAGGDRGNGNGGRGNGVVVAGGSAGDVAIPGAAGGGVGGREASVRDGVA